eukprot:gene25086-31010_t
MVVACLRGHADVVRLLLRDGRADPQGAAAGGPPPMLMACVRHVDVVRALLGDPRVDVSPPPPQQPPAGKTLTPIALAEREGHAEVVQLLRDALQRS